MRVDPAMRGNLPADRVNFPPKLKDTRPRRFLLAFLLTAAASIFAILCANLIVDPFGRFAFVSVSGFNAQKPDLSPAARMAKAQIVCRLQPSTILLGTSRAEVGLDPSAISSLRGVEYNLSLAGSGLAEVSMMLRHAANASPNLTDAFIGLDFLMFNANREAVVFGTEVFGFDKERLMLSPSDSCWEKLLYDADMYLGARGLYHSWRTVTNQLPLEQKAKATHQEVGRWKSLYNELGFRDQFDAVDAIVRKTGVRAYIGTRAEAGYVAKVWRPAPRHRYCFSAPGRTDTFAEFREMVRFSYHSGIRLHLMINPVHARMLIALKDAGLWPQYEEWKRSLVRILQEEARGKADPYELWDFSGFNSITEERIPADGDHTPSTWFWDPSHYKKAAGDLMLSRVVGTSDTTNIPDDFGLILTEDNVEAFIALTRELSTRYETTFPDESALIKAAVDEVLRGSFGSNCGFDEDMLQAGVDALRKGRSVDAGRLFSTAMEMHENEKRRYAAIGAPFREDGFERNLAVARNGHDVELTAADWREYFARGDARAELGDTHGAIEDYTEAIRLASRQVKPRGKLAMYFRRAQAYADAGRLSEAANDYRAILSIDPSNAAVMKLLDDVSARVISLSEEK